MDGQVAPTVSRVRIRTTDGTTLQASVGGGFFFAWWPSSSPAASITASALDGTVLGVCRMDTPSTLRSYRCQTP